MPGGYLFAALKFLPFLLRLNLVMQATCQNCLPRAAADRNTGERAAARPCHAICSDEQENKFAICNSRYGAWTAANSRFENRVSQFQFHSAVLPGC